MKKQENEGIPGMGIYSVHCKAKAFLKQREECIVYTTFVKYNLNDEAIRPKSNGNYGQCSLLSTIIS